MIFIVQLFIIFIASVIIAKGSDCLIEASSRLAKSLGVSQLIIGLTIIAAGTSAPEAIILQKPLAESVLVSSNSTASIVELIIISTIIIFFMWSQAQISRLEGVILVLLGINCWATDFN